MAVLAGSIARGEIQALPPLLTPDLDQHTAGMGGGAVGGLDSGGAAGGSGVVGLVSQVLQGQEAPMFGGELFEKILVLPREKDAGFVISPTAWDVEVWNSHRGQARILAAVGIAGPGGLSLSGGLGTSATFGPGRSSIYLATLAGVGDATIRSVATWHFTGESGADMTVTGTRLTLFSPRCDWSEPPRERLSWLTTVLTSYEKSEQRAALRQEPRVTLVFRVVTTTPRETAALETLLFGWQARTFGVPLWPQKSPLLAPAAPGDLSLQVDSTLRPGFLAGGLVALWADPHTWRAFQVNRIEGSTLHLESQVLEDWPAGTWVVPVLRGGLLADQQLGRPANWVSAGLFEFSCEAV